MGFFIGIIAFQVLEILVLRWGLRLQGRTFAMLVIVVAVFLLPLPYQFWLIHNARQPPTWAAALIVRPTYAWHFNWLTFMFFIAPVIVLVRVGGSISGWNGAVPFLRWLVAAILGVWGILTIYGLAATLRSPELEKMEIEIPGLSQKEDGLKIAQISDMHFAWWNSQAEMRRIGGMIAPLNPDLFVITGDMVDHNPDYVYKLADCLEMIKPRLGKFAIIGNHDVYTGADEVARRMQERGFTMLRGSSASLKDKGADLTLAGMDDSGERWTGADPAEKNIPEIVARCPKDSPIILLAHRPSAFDRITGLPIALTLSGHTHGGQLRLPFGLPGLADIGFKRPSGLYQKGNQSLYVTRGTGTVGWPFRLNCPEEITLITLRAPKSSN